MQRHPNPPRHLALLRAIHQGNKPRVAPEHALYNKLWGNIISWLFPARCASCDNPLETAEQMLGCKRCPFICSPQAAYLEELPIIAGAAYGGALKQAILRLKYHNQPEIAPRLAAWLGSALELNAEPQRRNSPHAAQGLLQPLPWLIPVPLHPKRLVERGYNQAGLLTSTLAKRLGLPQAHLALVRQNETAAQASLGAAERRKNLHYAFKAHPKLAQKSVIFVDDVATTGSTLAACAKACQQAGATPLGALVVALA